LKLEALTGSFLDMEVRLEMDNEGESVSMAVSKVSLQTRPSSGYCCLLFNVVIAEAESICL
jgi:hypothetical protein